MVVAVGGDRSPGRRLRRRWSTSARRRSSSLRSSGPNSRVCSVSLVMCPPSGACRPRGDGSPVGAEPGSAPAPTVARRLPIDWRSSSRLVPTEASDPLAGSAFAAATLLCSWTTAALTARTSAAVGLDVRPYGVDRGSDLRQPVLQRDHAVLAEGHVAQVLVGRADSVRAGAGRGLCGLSTGSQGGRGAQCEHDGCDLSPCPCHTCPPCLGRNARLALPFLPSSLADERGCAPVTPPHSARSGGTAASSVPPTQS